MDKWTWRHSIACWIHRLAYRIIPDEEHEILVRDSDGVELCSVGFTGGFVATHPPVPYTLHCRHYADDDDMDGTVEDL